MEDGDYQLELKGTDSDLSPTKGDRFILAGQDRRGAVERHGAGVWEHDRRDYYQ